MTTRPAPLLSALIPLRDRSGTRLENCLRALRWQQLRGGAESLEIILSDFGSAPEHRDAIASLARRYEARVVRTETQEIWNRSRVLNIGIRAARGRYVFCTDADMILSPGFAQAILDAHADSRGALVVSRCYDLPESVPEQLWTLDDFPRLAAAATVRMTSGTGACQSATRAFFEAVRGYDEQYVFWGAEDNDMVTRALRYGLKLRWLHQHALMLHQWHPTVKRDERWLIFKNRLRYRLTRHQIVKNPDAWGGAP